MERALTALVLAAVVLAVAALVQRRRPDAPVRTGYAVPQQLDRADFDRAGAAWLVAVFTSATCDSCAGVWDRARHLESGEVAVQELEVTARKDLHDRYRIEAVPTTVVADAAGVVRRSWVGPITAADLWAALAEVREAG